MQQSIVLRYYAFIGVRKSNVDFTYPVIRVEISVVGCTSYRAAKEKMVC
jgi:hypothetical protein